jgi:hypothetical protein
MNLLSYSLLVLGCFGGVIAGYILALIAPEELLFGKKYFELFYRLMLLGTLSIAAFLIINPIVGILVFIALAYPVIKSSISYLKYPYLTLGILAFPFVDSPDKLLIIASLTFVTGLPLASLEAIPFVRKERITDKLRVARLLLLRYIWFIPIGVLPFVLAKL